MLSAVPPRPVHGEVNVGCFIFPGWHNPTWWRSVAGGSRRRPLLGYYDDTLPSVSDWHIRWAVEHGIGFFAFNWYWNRGEKRLDAPLESGFLKARHRDLVKFCVHWCPEFGIEKADFWSNDADLSRSALLEMLQYCGRHYFALPNYLRIGTRPVFMIFKPVEVVRANGGVAGFRQTRRELDRLLHGLGLEDLFLVAVSQDADGLEAEELESAGFDALTAYSYAFKLDPRYDRCTCGASAPYEDMVEQYEAAWKAVRATTSLPYIVPVSPGWDDRPWRGFEALWRTGSTPARFREMLRRSLRYIDPELKMVIIEAWNEWGEGSFVEPSRASGFAYLEAVRDVYAGPRRFHVDLRPGQADVRASSAFTAEEIRCLESNTGADEVYLSERPAACPVEIDPRLVGEIVDSRVFDDCGTGGCAVLGMDPPGIVGGFLHTVIRGADPGVTVSGFAARAGDADCVAIRLRVDAHRVRHGQLFWVDDLCTDGFSEYRSEYFRLSRDGRFHVYCFSFRHDPRWRSVVRAVRIDLHGPVGSAVDMDWIRFVRGPGGDTRSPDASSVAGNVEELRDDVLEGWRFNEPGNARGWGVLHMLQPGISDGELTTVVSGPAPMIARLVRVPTSAVTAAAFRMRIGVQSTDGRPSGAVLWKHSAAGFGVMAESFGTQGQAFELVADGQYHDYCVPMIFDPGRAELTGIAIDFWRGGIQTGTPVAIEWIRLMRKPGPTLREPSPGMRVIHAPDISTAVCAGNVDAIERDDSGRFRVKGWAGFRASGEPAEEIWIVLGDRVLGMLPKEWFFARPDVVTALQQPRLLMTGFSIVLGEHADVSTLRVLARRVDGRLFGISTDHAVMIRGGDRPDG